MFLPNPHPSTNLNPFLKSQSKMGLVPRDFLPSQLYVSATLNLSSLSILCGLQLPYFCIYCSLSQNAPAATVYPGPALPAPVHLPPCLPLLTIRSTSLLPAYLEGGWNVVGGWLDVGLGLAQTRGLGFGWSWGPGCLTGCLE